jgi:hypothetical protein
VQVPPPVHTSVSRHLGGVDQQTTQQVLDAHTQQPQISSGMRLRPRKPVLSTDNDYDERPGVASDDMRSPSPFQPANDGANSGTESDASTPDSSDSGGVLVPRKRKRPSKPSKAPRQKRKRISSSSSAHLDTTPPVPSKTTAHKTAKRRGPPVPPLSVNGETLLVNGRQCSHASEDGTQDACLVLKHFGLLDEVIGDQHVVFCKEHVTAIPLDTLASHLSVKHRDQCNKMLGKRIGKTGNADVLLSPLVGHIANSLDIHPKQSLSDILNLELAHPIAHGFPEPRPSVQCPNCKVWFFCKLTCNNIFKNLQDHVFYQKKAEECKKVWEALPPGAEKNLTVRYTQSLFSGGYSAPKVVLQEGWTPESAQRPGDSTTVPSQEPQAEKPDNDEDFGIHDQPVAEWLNTIGWPEWFDSCRTLNGKTVELDAEDILQFIALPSHRRVSTSLPEKEQAIENGLRVVSRFPRDYLMDANLFVRSQHIQVRHSVTEGYIV